MLLGTGCGGTFELQNLDGLGQDQLAIDPLGAEEAYLAGSGKELVQVMALAPAAMLGMKGEEITSQPRMVLGVPATREGCQRYWPF